jgi:hypothetical protein
MRWRLTKLLVIMGAPPPDSQDANDMPTTFRFLMAAAALAGLGYGALFLLANVLEPTPQELTVTVPPARYAK